MTLFQNNTVINKSVNEVYQFLEDLNNHEELMPDNIYNWSSTRNEARFTIKNMAKLVLRVSHRKLNEEVTCTPVEQTPFELELIWKTDSLSENETKVSFTIAADLNMMMKMVASAPLQKLVDYQVDKLKLILG